MYLIAFCCVLLVTTPATTGQGFSSDSNCSSIPASSNTVPTILLVSENPTDEALLGRAFMVRKMSLKPRKFEIRCMAPYPINLELNSELKKDLTKLTAWKKYDIAIKTFTITTYFYVGPEDKFYINVSCMPDCGPSRFSFGIRVFTMKTSNNWLKLVVQNISLQQGGEVRRNNAKVGIFITLGACIVWSAVLACVLISWNNISSELRSQQEEQDELFFN